MDGTVFRARTRVCREGEGEGEGEGREEKKI